MSPEVPDRLRKDSLTAQIMYSEVWRRANIQNQHFVLCIVGREGSGKSGTALSLASALDPEFDASRVCFEPSQMLRLIDGPETSTGSALVLDEAGVGMGARSWYDQDQIKLNQTLQTIRDDNQILILTLPALSELDSMTVNRLHAYAECVSLTEGERVNFKFKFLHPQRGPSGDTYEKYPRRRVDGRLCKVKLLSVGPPPADIWQNYEERKSAWKSELYDDTIHDLEDDADDEQTAADVAEAIRSNGGAEHYIREINNGTQKFVDADRIAAEHGVGKAKAKRVKSLLLDEVGENVM